MHPYQKPAPRDFSSTFAHVSAEAVFDTIASALANLTIGSSAPEHRLVWARNMTTCHGAQGSQTFDISMIRHIYAAVFYVAA
jgi:hypothetical protein